LWYKKYVFSSSLPSQTPVSFFQKRSAKPNVAVNEIKAVAAEDRVRPLISLAYCLWILILLVQVK